MKKYKIKVKKIINLFEEFEVQADDFNDALNQANEIIDFHKNKDVQQENVIINDWSIVSINKEI